MAAIIHQPGSAANHKTGDWRSRRPEMDNSKCAKCKICWSWIFCPEAAQSMNEHGYYEVNLYHCKGCGICARECVKGAITMVEEGE